MGTPTPEQPRPAQPLILRRGKDWTATFVKIASTAITDAMSVNRSGRVVIVDEHDVAHIGPVTEVTNGHATLTSGTVLDLTTATALVIA